MGSRSHIAGDRSMTTALAVFVGGMVGTLARFGLDLWWPHDTLGSLSVSTAFVNVVGSFALGFLVGGMWKRPSVPEWVKAGLGPGILGSFTTMSGVVLNLIAGAGEGKWADALLALSVSLVVGLAAAWLGLKLGALTSSAASMR